MPVLTYVDLQETKVTAAGLAAFAKLRPDCTVLHPDAIQNPAERQTAQWALSNGGKVYTSGAPVSDGNIPDKAFAVVQINFPHDVTVSNADALSSVNLEVFRGPALTSELARFVSRQKHLRDLVFGGAGPAEGGMAPRWMT